MDIILREDVEKLGVRGQVVKVAAGYARNFLLPKRLAVAATDSNKKIVEQERQAHLRKEVVAKGEAEDLAKNEHKAFIETDSWETPVLDWLNTKSQHDYHLNKDHPFSMNQVLTSAINKTSDKCGRVDEMRMAKVLQVLILM